MYKKLYFWFYTVSVIFVFSTASLGVTAEVDPCKKEGLVVKNLSMTNLWYKIDNGDCIIWKRNYTFVIKPENTIKIFSDLVCETLYCAENPTYADYKSSDTDGDCRVRILPGCNISDM